MSDTPRTDAKSVRFSTLCAERDQWWVSRETSRQLERELASANERIRRLEAAGNAMSHEMQFGEWRAGTPRAQANAARRAWLAEMGGRV